MKMYYVEVECIAEITEVPKEFQNIRITLLTDKNVNGNHEYTLNYEDRAVLIKFAKELGFQDAEDFVEEMEESEEDMFMTLEELHAQTKE